MFFQCTCICPSSCCNKTVLPNLRSWFISAIFFRRLNSSCGTRWMADECLSSVALYQIWRVSPCPWNGSGVSHYYSSSEVSFIKFLYHHFFYNINGFNDFVFSIMLLAFTLKLITGKYKYEIDSLNLVNVFVNDYIYHIDDYFGDANSVVNITLKINKIII